MPQLPVDVAPCKVTILGVTVLVAQEDVRRLTERMEGVFGKHHWVLVKGYHDSGTINGVYGPYAEAYIDWLLGGLLKYTTDNWTKIKLSSGPEET